MNLNTKVVSFSIVVAKYVLMFGISGRRRTYVTKALKLPTSFANFPFLECQLHSIGIRLVTLYADFVHVHNSVLSS